MVPLVIIKLGGSVLTFKERKVPKARLKNTSRLAKDLAQLVERGKYRIIVVHGAGSFGHPIAKENNLHKGMKTAKEKLAFAQTNQNVLDLNKLLVKSLLNQLVPAVSLPPHSFVRQSKGKFKDINCDIIQKCLKEGQMPVLFGDAVYDDAWGCSILSGDTIVSFLAKKLKAEKVIFLTDVDGVFEQNPKSNPHAKLIPKINNKNLKEVLKILSNNIPSGADVTGEMGGKVMAIKEVLKGVRVVIINGFKEKSLIKAIEDKSVGTMLRF